MFGTLGLDGTLRLTAAVALIVGLGWVILNARPWDGPPTSWIADTQYYYGAGERLNAGHLLYAYSPGDRQLNVDPFAFAGPFLYPPLIAVLWRPLALLDYGPVVVAWWAVGLVTFVLFLAGLLKYGGAATAAGCLLLLPPLAETAWSGNVSTFITPAIVMSWFLVTRGRPRIGGAMIGFLAVAKLTPVFLVFWLVATRRWAALASAVAAATIGAVLTIGGAGFVSILDYLRVTNLVSRHGGTQISITGIASQLGAPSDLLAIAAPVVAVLGSVAILATRRNHRLAWTAAICTGILASPVLNLTNASLLLAAFVPFDGFGSLPVLGGRASAVGRGHGTAGTA
ncbi:MAG: glycosyltransferase family 87 protein [Candidatus Limnocylindrales bacterium]